MWTFPSSEAFQALIRNSYVANLIASGHFPPPYFLERRVIAPNALTILVRYELAVLEELREPDSSTGEAADFAYVDVVMADPSPMSVELLGRDF